MSEPVGEQLNTGPSGAPVDEDRVEHRAALLPEEEVAGSDDPELQAQIILEDSDARTADPEATRQDSVQTPDATGHPDRFQAKPAD
jgi:hypothetical protein